MHSSVFSWVGDMVFRIGAVGTVLELGSRNVNGSVRVLFPIIRYYVGVDRYTGRGVNVQANANAVPFPDESFDLVVSTEMLEHDLLFWRSLAEARRVLRPGGYLLLTCRGLGFPVHGFPNDFYRFTPPAILELLCELGFVALEVRTDPQYPGVFAYARKPAQGERNG